MFFQSKVLQSLSILRHVQHLFYFQKKLNLSMSMTIISWFLSSCVEDPFRGGNIILCTTSYRILSTATVGKSTLSILPSITAVIQYARYKHLWIYVVNRSREPWISIRPGPDPALTYTGGILRILAHITGVLYDNWNHQSIQYPTHNTRACLRLRYCEYMYIVFVFVLVVFVVVVVVVERGVLCVMRVNAGTIDYVRINVRMY